ncbi:hypothetical protein KFL_007240020 [Klebsormidium nitens]|uniref:NIDO domain-containing protein n=1 Tax=Klebsormidium nitens TaxID=105231 RepID=A0A1Y1IJK6_KLENI|nr:hypothetical protein KFL_007240020 [Klebsormidium nitens]|eukprot:GAQ91075.1 hypothetical protein KFL_007240020 [Klebsormidium nitens]
MKFFGSTVSSLFVNINGDLTLDQEYGAYTSLPFPIQVGGIKIFAAFWADVDTNSDPIADSDPATSYVCYRSTADAADVSKFQGDIAIAFPSVTFNPAAVFIAFWHNVGYYPAQYNKRNTFQAVIGYTAGNTFVCYYYTELTWTTGQASGGTDGLGGYPAQVGFDAGDGVNYFSQPGSQTAAVLNFVRESNMGVPGKFCYQVAVAIQNPTGVYAGGPYSVQSGSSITLTGEASNDGSLCGPLTFSWDTNANPPAFNVDLTGPSPTFVANVPASFRYVVLRVTDNCGATSVDTYINVTGESGLG